MKNTHLKRYGIAILSLLLFTSVSNVFAQQSLIKVDGWNAYVHVPWDYDLHPAKDYATIIFIPGLGEVGSNAAEVIQNGPGAYIKQGWNGNVKVGNDSVKFIIVSLQPPSAWPRFSEIDSRIEILRSKYRIDTSKLHLTGLSMGGWASMCFVTADPLGGPYHYVSQIASVVSVEGVQASDNAPWPNRFDNMAIYGGKMINFEQINDYRKGDIAVRRMNTTEKGSAQYIQTSYGGGGHCCWEQFYGGYGHAPNNFVLEGVSQNIYQWMARNPLTKTTSILPVTLNNFSAKNDNEANLLKWSTSTEINSNYFEIQRSNDGVNFSKIGLVYASGNTSTLKQYQFTDKQPLKGLNLYRLSVVDLDGKMKYSKVISVEVKRASSFSIEKIGLSPQRNTLNIIVNSNKDQKMRATITDVSGRIYYTTSTQLLSGNTTISKNITGLSKGIYYLKLSTTEELITKPLFAD